MSAQEKIDRADAILATGIPDILSPEDVLALQVGNRLKRLRLAVADFMYLVQQYPEDALEIANDVKADPLFAPMMALLAV